MNAFKTVAVALGITLAAIILIPLIVLAGLFVWLKVTEEADEEILELDREGGGRGGVEESPEDARVTWEVVGGRGEIRQQSPRHFGRRQRSAGRFAQ